MIDRFIDEPHRSIAEPEMSATGVRRLGPVGRGIRITGIASPAEKRARCTHNAVFPRTGGKIYRRRRVIPHGTRVRPALPPDPTLRAVLPDLHKGDRIGSSILFAATSRSRPSTRCPRDNHHVINFHTYFQPTIPIRFGVDLDRFRQGIRTAPLITGRLGIEDDSNA